MAEGRNGSSTLAQLGAVVDGLSVTVTSLDTRLNARLDSQNAKIDLLFRPNLAVWFGGASLLLTLSMAVLGAGAVWTSQTIAPIKEDVIEVKRALERAVKNELDNDRDLRNEIKEARLERREELRIMRDEARGERAAIIQEFKETRNSIVPRGEHEQRWAANVAALAAMERRLDETRKQVNEISSPQDAFKLLERQISELRAVVFKNNSRSGSSP